MRLSDSGVMPTGIMLYHPACHILELAILSKHVRLFVQISYHKHAIFRADETTLSERLLLVTCKNRYKLLFRVKIRRRFLPFLIDGELSHTYKPYLTLFILILTCAFIVSAVTLVFPLLVRYITKDVLEGDLSDALREVYWIGGLMLVLVVIQNVGNYFVDYKGHKIGALMESDMRSELFTHMQKLPFSFYDKEKTGQLMSRITNDLLLLSELYHHGPEDYMKYLVRFIGAFIILYYITAPLTIAVFCFLPVLAVFTFYFNKRLNQALRRNKERIGDVNVQVEDSLSGIRVVQSFANEQIEIEKFNHTRQKRSFTIVFNRLSK